MTSSDFNWNDVAGDVVVPEQPGIAVYTNSNGAVVIRQAGQYGPDEDHWIYFHPMHAVAIAQAILDAAGAPMQIVEITEAGEKNGGTTKDLTAAERSRRYRQNKKRDDRDAGVTQRDVDRDADRDGRDASRLPFRPMSFQSCDNRNTGRCRAHQNSSAGAPVCRVKTSGLVKT